MILPGDLFHAHLTFPSFNSELIKGWKRTEIMLLGSSIRVDEMITKHYMIGNTFKSFHEILEDCKQVAQLYNAVRVKIEKDNSFEYITQEKYLEVHCKVKGNCNLDMSWVRSKNPKDLEKSVYFYNKRIYSGNFNEQASLIRKEVLLNVPECLDLRFEQIVFDSNREHDSWWANVK